MSDQVKAAAMDFIRKHEEWEAKILMDSRLWSTHEERSPFHFYDLAVEVQYARNRLRVALGESLFISTSKSHIHGGPLPAPKEETQ